MHRKSTCVDFELAHNIIDRECFLGVYCCLHCNVILECLDAEGVVATASGFSAGDSMNSLMFYTDQ